MRSLIASLVLSALSISQAWADQALDQLRACRRMPDSAARLECFDRASDALLMTKPTDAALMAKPPDDAPSPAKRSNIESSIVGIYQPAAGRAAFTLENGQVWRQMDAENARSAKIGDRVVISKTFLGAYWLKIEGGHEWRVTLDKR